MKTLKILSFFLLVILFGCTEETIINNYSAEGLGKVNVYIEGDITNAEAQAQLEEEVGTLTENIYIQNTTQLTAISIIGNSKLRNVTIDENNSLNIINVNAISNLTSFIVKDTNNQLANINLNGTGKVTEVEIKNSKQNSTILIDGFTIADKITIETTSNTSNNKTATITCNDLIEINKFLSINTSVSQNNTVSFTDLKIMGKYVSDTTYFFNIISGKFTVASFPILEEIYNLTLDGLHMDTITFPLVEKMNYFYLSIDSYINHFNFPQLTRCDNFQCEFNTGSLGTTYFTDTLFNMPLLNYCKNYSLNILGLDNFDAEDILEKFLTIQPVSGKTINLSNDAPLTGLGLTYKQTLINQGNTVIVW
ncbi:hypothetical protein B0A58_03980 [Flavobacterium branchiophilum NBRC 15030 = ATCC 35035]|uniref:Lipoprotein n=1 Tax=Flavobacterium branchiophilum TaxID=55197 RepID=A0A543G235_9FLAO|nr:hypothetical protein [Flavobacterium branchiophilum]OXA78976.1 hypothetical protein B0A58_03980 [Flavobacterium branchiophilum NBRC 15030 = ATCC 35035]TQM40105.1 hypothetical protein BC670_0970 [Flavobacterium branchiophilum]GEM56729.1 hypothetical protein FB1_29500 [Flavobacterium branchiophilum NBRC 15030 = ATCC 35035]